MSNETIHQINVTKYFIPLPEGDYDFQEHLTDYLLTDILNANKQINKLEVRVKELERKLQIAEICLQDIATFEDDIIARFSARKALKQMEEVNANI